MTVNVLPVSSVINVTVNLPAVGAQGPDLSTLLVLGSSDVIDVVQRIRFYSSLEEVTADFGSSGPEYNSAKLWFSQSPKPSRVAVGRWALTPTKGQLVCGELTPTNTLLATWTAISDGGLHVSVDGTPQTVISLDFSLATTLQGVAGIIDAGISGATVTYNSVYNRFTVESATTGASSTVSFLTAGTGMGVTDIATMMAGTAISSGAYAANGIVAETLTACLTIFDTDFGQSWYAAMAPEDVTAASILAAAQYVQGSSNPHLFGETDQAPAVISSGDTTSVAFVLNAAGNLYRTVTQYSSTSAYAIASYLGRILTVNYNESLSDITMMYKQEPGVTPENLNTTQAGFAASKKCNVLAAYNNQTAIIQQGTQCDGTFTDIVTFVDWLATTMQTAVFNLMLQTSTKIAQTDAGVHQIVTTVAQVCAQGVLNGGMAPGVWTTDGFGTLSKGDFIPSGFYIFAPPVATQNAADRAARKSVPIQVAVKLAGAIHDVFITINVNP